MPQDKGFTAPRVGGIRKPWEQGSGLKPARLAAKGKERRNEGENSTVFICVSGGRDGLAAVGPYK